MARRGRPKKENVIRFPCGDIREEIMEAPFNMTFVQSRIVRDEQNKEVTLYEREVPLSLLFRAELIDDLQKEAGERLYSLWDAMRRVALDALPPYAKISRPERGFSHAPEATEDDIERGQRLQAAYDSAYRALVNQGTNAVISVEAVCFGPVRAWTQSGLKIDDLRKGLDGLVVHFGLSNSKTRVA